MAEQILWCLEIRGEFYKRQRRFYEEVLTNRTWAGLVDGYIAVIDEIALKEAKVSTERRRLRA